MRHSNRCSPRRDWLQQVEEDVGLSVGAAWIAGQDRSMWRTLRPSAGQAQQWVSEYYWYSVFHLHLQFSVWQWFQIFSYLLNFVEYETMFCRSLHLSWRWKFVWVTKAITCQVVTMWLLSATSLISSLLESTMVGFGFFILFYFFIPCCVALS